MLMKVDEVRFQPINRGYNSVFRPDRLSLGLVTPLEAYPHGPVPSMTRHLERIRLAEELGFSAIWLRDVPFNVPSFGDAGQVYDPFVYLGLLAGRHIGLCWVSPVSCCRFAIRHMSPKQQPASTYCRAGDSSSASPRATGPRRIRQSA